MIGDLLYFLLQNNLSLGFTLLSAVYVWPGPKDFCFFESKSTTPWSKLKLWTLWTVDAHAKRKWVILIDGDAEAFIIGISVSLFFNPYPTVLPIELPCSLCLVVQKIFKCNMMIGDNVNRSNFPQLTIN